jgi:hypothetical protein
MGSVLAWKYEIITGREWCSVVWEGVVVSKTEQGNIPMLPREIQSSNTVGIELKAGGVESTGSSVFRSKFSSEKVTITEMDIESWLRDAYFG